MPKCKETQVLEDPFGGVAALGCDLEEYHAESFHEDQLQRTRWMKMEDEEPAMVISLPVPPPLEITEQRNVRTEDVGYASRAKIPAAAIVSGHPADS